MSDRVEKLDPYCPVCGEHVRDHDYSCDGGITVRAPRNAVESGGNESGRGDAQTSPDRAQPLSREVEVMDDTPFGASRKAGAR